MPSNVSTEYLLYVGVGTDLCHRIQLSVINEKTQNIRKKKHFLGFKQRLSFLSLSQTVDTCTKWKEHQHTRISSIYTPQQTRQHFIKLWKVARVLSSEKGTRTNLRNPLCVAKFNADLRLPHYASQSAKTSTLKGAVITHDTQCILQNICYTWEWVPIFLCHRIQLSVINVKKEITIILWD